MGKPGESRSVEKGFIYNLNNLQQTFFDNKMSRDMGFWYSPTCENSGTSEPSEATDAFESIKPNSETCWMNM